MSVNPLQRMLEKINEAGLWQGDILLKRNDYLKTEGTKDTRVYFIHQGSLRMFVAEEGEEHTIRFGYQGNLVAALDSFFSEKSSPLIIQALRKTRISFISKEMFSLFLNEDEENRNLWIQILQGLMVQQLEREVDLLTTSPAERYRRVFERSPHLFQKIPHRYIAAYLRMTPETLSRLQKS
ncbi:MAG: Crp/Fnr family transcriptional regulator [Chitinophagaceae bacterium]|jgi:CRP-like cAMP-binding protein|nr:Crp/Fnr family transcriptional regulator [Chitinophagaceae bacterium]